MTDHYGPPLKKLFAMRVSTLLRPVLLAAFLLAPAVQAAGLVAASAGELPIVITAPHGGREDVPGCELRTPVGTRFVTSIDLDTDELARRIAAEIERLTGRPPYLVIARFHRKYIDANRRLDEAYAGAGCQAIYDEFHAAVRRFVDDVRARHPNAVLFDIHGQAKYPDSILRGTQHGGTVKSLLARAGDAAVTGPHSVFGQFAGMGYAIEPSNDLPATARVETQGYTGGHIVVTYGSNRSDGVDAIQLEFGRNLRRKDALAKTAADTARAIVTFYEAYLRGDTAR